MGVYAYRIDNDIRVHECVVRSALKDGKVFWIIQTVVLPQVKATGVDVEKTSTNILQVVSIFDTTDSFDEIELSSYVSLNVKIHSGASMASRRCGFW